MRLLVANSVYWDQYVREQQHLINAGKIHNPPAPKLNPEYIEEINMKEEDDFTKPSVPITPAEGPMPPEVEEKVLDILARLERLEKRWQ